MRGRKIGGLIVVIMYLLTSGSVLFAQDYDYATKAKDISFAWKVTDSALQVKLSAKTTGWVGIAFNPSSKMKGANFVLGYVKKNGKVKISDDYGDTENSHKPDKKLGGSNNVTTVGGSEKDGVTTLEFSIPLDSGEQTDTVIIPDAATVVLLAYGGKRDSFKAKHAFRTAIKVNLLTGEVK
ncbi:MAG: DOMON domain-containing protein [Candidatus Electrothrix sp. AR4]|nr:DOMON domain-containing protein [Candidatus Electrothrix sp. AR4]